MENKREAYLFFDESGNTGTNWLDQKQPYYIYGGWMLMKDKKEDAENGIKKIFSSSKAKELKSSYIIEKKRPDFKKFFDFFIFEMDAIPVFGVADKRYMIAAKIIETFFDREYNPNVNGYLIFKSDLKKALADSVSSNQYVLQRFVKLINEGTMQLFEMREISVLLAEHFKNNKHMDVFQALTDLTDDNLKEMIGEFEYISKNGSEKKWLSLTQPILFDRLWNIEQLAEICNLQVKPYVDELWGYKPVFEQINKLACTGKKAAFFQHFNSIEQCVSHEELLIQAADLLCGFINRSLTEIEKFQDDIQIKEIWKNLVGIRDCFTENKIVIWDYYAHNDFINKMGLLVGVDVLKYKDESDKIISRDFSIAKK